MTRAEKDPKITRAEKDPKITKQRNGVKNYINFIENSHPGKQAFPVTRDYLNEYFTYKIDVCKTKTKTLTLYLANIKAHNKALGFGWKHSIFNAIEEKIKIQNKIASPSTLNASFYEFDPQLSQQVSILPISDIADTSQLEQSYDSGFTDVLHPSFFIISPQNDICSFNNVQTTLLNNNSYDQSFFGTHFPQVCHQFDAQNNA
ncbi:345_t:CDS:2 [Racocetra persica]|uniref:345_t:CDS:1 n=1 Tax=Racocetra persica TaxID=160502 RepID=A0ACA9M3U7_9GLOM|nr:345_t:CDS:2 [Racocetra persica]